MITCTLALDGYEHRSSREISSDHREVSTVPGSMHKVQQHTGKHGMSRPSLLQ